MRRDRAEQDPCCLVEEWLALMTRSNDLAEMCAEAVAREPISGLLTALGCRDGPDARAALKDCDGLRDSGR